MIEIDQFELHHDTPKNEFKIRQKHLEILFDMSHLTQTSQKLYTH